MAHPGFFFRTTAMPTGEPWGLPRSPICNDDAYQTSAHGDPGRHHRSSSAPYATGTTSSFHLPSTLHPHPAVNTSTSNSGIGAVTCHSGRADIVYTSDPPYSLRPAQRTYSESTVPYSPYQRRSPRQWDRQERFSSDSMDDVLMSPSFSDYALDNVGGTTPPPPGRSKVNLRGRPQRRSSNRDEFDGPHQFLKPPSPDYVARQERKLPHLPTNLEVQEQDSVLSLVNDRLSRCAYDFVAKYQFPIPLTQDMRPVQRPEDREWTEWVYLLKRLATKRRIPARVLYNGQIKQFITILENSLEMRHAAKHQSRPLKDDRNILQLISAGIQVAKILKDAQAMDDLDRVYVSTENRIQERVVTARFRPS